MAEAISLGSGSGYLAVFGGPAYSGFLALSKPDVGHATAGATSDDLFWRARLQT
jgi:hypothetical protein